MSKKKYRDINFRADSLETIEKINSILGEYKSLGYDLSLRKLYYQLVARGFIENTERSYKNVGNLLTNSRLAGLVDWDMIKDRNREVIKPTTWDNPGHIIRAAASQFQIDKWKDQPNYIEVMVEKDALSGVLEPVCLELGIPFTANKGYPSVSLLFEMGQRLIRKWLDGKQIYILHLGDHDPSGMDMTRDLEDRLEMFSAGRRILINRLALNMDQVEEMNPPPNPAKTTDSRYSSYSNEFGELSWELDAIEPSSLAHLVRASVDSLLDNDLWSEALEHEREMIQQLNNLADNFSQFI